MQTIDPLERLVEYYTLPEGTPVTEIDILTELQTIAETIQSISVLHATGNNKDKHTEEIEMGRLNQYGYVVLECKKRHLDWERCQADNDILSILEKYPPE